MNWDVALSIGVTLLTCLAPLFIGAGAPLKKLTIWSRAGKPERTLKMSRGAISLMLLLALVAVSALTARASQRTNTRLRTEIGTRQSEDDAKERSDVGARERAAERWYDAERHEATQQKLDEALGNIAAADRQARDDAILLHELGSQNVALAQQIHLAAQERDLKLIESEALLQRLAERMGQLSTRSLSLDVAELADLRDQVSLVRTQLAHGPDLGDGAALSGALGSRPTVVYSWVGQLSGGTLAAPITITMDKTTGPRRPPGGSVNVSIVEWGLALAGTIRSTPRMGATATVSIASGRWKGRQLRVTLPAKGRQGTWTLYGDGMQQLSTGILAEEPTP